MNCEDTDQEMESKKVPTTVKEMYDTQYHAFIQRQHVIVSILEKMHSMEKKLDILNEKLQ